MSVRVGKLLLRNRRWILVAVHAAVLTVSYTFAFALRFDFSIQPVFWELFRATLVWILPLKLFFFWRFGSFRGWWRYITFADLVSLLRVSTLSTLAIAGIDYFAIGWYQIPRAVLLLDWVMTILLVGGIRSFSRLIREHVFPMGGSGRQPALMIGAVQGGADVARQIHQHPKLDYRIIGFLDENAGYLGSSLGGIRFLGLVDEAVAIAHQHDVEDILVISNSVSGTQLRELMEQCRSAGIAVKMIPAVDDLLNGAFRPQIRDVDINDLLRRDPVELDRAAIAHMLKGRRILVTGAGGSIGSEMCRQVLRAEPECLAMVELSENSLFYIERELRQIPSQSELVACIADIRDEERMRSIFRMYRPQVVLHAAAHKHVPMMELNPGEGVKNNIFGTRLLADLSSEYGVEKFVLISSDKAVCPSSVMGACKRVAEQYILSVNAWSSTAMLAVRFGNVLGSAGSVVPLFQEQIRRGGPVTLTHPEMTRFFMTIPEASQLVLQAATMGHGGEVFVLDMGEPVRIMDLANELIRLSGVSLDEIEITIQGPRPGEKLHEILHPHGAALLNTDHPKVRLLLDKPPDISELRAAIDSLERLTHESAEAIREGLAQLLADYDPPTWPENHDVVSRPGLEPATL